MGPVGSSKSSACCLEMFTRATEQAAHVGVRRTRWAVIRNTYPELKSTTIKTWQEWFPFAPMKWDAPISSHISLPLPDGTKLDMEVLFFPVDRPEEIGKLKSLELTGAWINEAAEVPKAVFDMCTQRVGRFPPVRTGGPTWSGVIMDTNPPDDDHWYYKLAEKDSPPEWRFFKQPGGLVEHNGTYAPNADAENVENLPSGHDYYLRQLPGKSKEWIKVFLLGNYGSVQDGKPVYPEYADDLHCRLTKVWPKVPLLLGFDYGLTPACVICQITPHGTLQVLDEIWSEDSGVMQFARDMVRPHLAQHYAGMSFMAAGDPSGMSRKDTDERTVFQLLAEEGFPCVPAPSNAFVARRESVARYLTKLVDRAPALIVDPKCDMVRRGFNGRYKYRRIQLAGQERYRDIPEKNEYSHLHDALQYAALHAQNMNNSTEWAKPISYPAKHGIV